MERKYISLDGLAHFYDGLKNKILHTPIDISVEADGWSSEDTLFKKEIANESFKSTDNLAYLAYVVQSGTEETDATARSAYGQLVRGTIGDGNVTLYALKQPSDAFTVRIVSVSTKTPVTDIINIGSGGGGGGGASAANDIKEATVTLEQDTFPYDGEQHTPKVTKVELKGVQLNEGADYYVVAEPKTDAGNYSVIVVGVFNYSGSVSKSWSITKAEDEITLSAETLTVKGVMGTSDESITVSHTGTGALSAEVTDGEDGGSVTAEIDVNKVKITSKKAGACTVTVKSAADTNYNAASKAITVTVERADGKISVAPAEVTISGEAGTTATATLTITGEASPTITYDGGETTYTDYFTVSRSEKTLTLTSVAATESPVTLNINMAQSDNYTAAKCTLKVSCVFKGKIYGVEWDKTAATTLTRTDDASGFGDPNPYVNDGSHESSCSSPFDSIAPWSGVKEKEIDGNKMVEIPKFYFKWTDGDKLKLQISESSFDGAHVSPAHADRGDGKGERDVVYVGKYHCNTEYKSVAGTEPHNNMTRAAAREGITALGDGYYMYDYAMLWTIRMLYLVEYADWDSQKVIGWGCSASGKKYNMGATDNMPYHTGTMGTSREEYCDGVRYRYIEDPWGNVYDWCDGIRFNNYDVYVINNPEQYSDTENGQLVCHTQSSNNCIKAWNVPSEEGYEWALFPSDTTAPTSYDSYVADLCYLGSSYVVCYVGGYFSSSRYYGMFCSNSTTATYCSTYIGVRLQKLP